MRRLSLLAFLLLALAIAPANAAPQVALKSRVEASGAAVTLGDVFDGAGEAGARALGPAPRPGQTATLSARFLSAAAAAAGLDWTPPAGVAHVTVSRAGEGAPSPAARPASPARATALVRKNELVTLSYVAPGMKLTTRAKAMGDAAAGETVSLQPVNSAKIVLAVVIGPGAASVSP